MEGDHFDWDTFMKQSAEKEQATVVRLDEEPLLPLVPTLPVIEAKLITEGPSIKRKDTDDMEAAEKKSKTEASKKSIPPYRKPPKDVHDHRTLRNAQCVFGAHGLEVKQESTHQYYLRRQKLKIAFEPDPRYDMIDAMFPTASAKPTHNESIQPTSGDKVIAKKNVYTQDGAGNLSLQEHKGVVEVVEIHPPVNQARDFAMCRIVARPAFNDRTKITTGNFGTPLCDQCKIPVDLCWANNKCEPKEVVRAYCADPAVAMIHPRNWYTMEHTLSLCSRFSSLMMISRVACAVNKQIVPCVMERPVLKCIPASDADRKHAESTIAYFEKSSLNGKWSRLLYRATPMWWMFSLNMSAGSNFAEFMSRRLFNLDSVHNYNSTFACPMVESLWREFDQPATVAAKAASDYDPAHPKVLNEVQSVFQWIKCDGSTLEPVVMPQVSLSALFAVAILHPKSTPELFLQVAEWVIKFMMSGATDVAVKWQVLKADPYCAALCRAEADTVCQGRPPKRIFIQYMAYLMHMSALLVACRFRVSHFAELVANTYFAKLNQQVLSPSEVTKEFMRYNVVAASPLKDIVPFIASMAGMIPVDVMIATRHRYADWAQDCSHWLRAVIGITQHMGSINCDLRSVQMILSRHDWNVAFWRYLGWSTVVTTKYRLLTDLVPLPLHLKFGLKGEATFMSLYDVICNLMVDIAPLNNPVLQSAVAQYQHPKPSNRSVQEFVTPIINTMDAYVKTICKHQDQDTELEEMDVIKEDDSVNGGEEGDDDDDDDDDDEQDEPTNQPAV